MNRQHQERPTPSGAKKPAAHYRAPDSDTPPPVPIEQVPPPAVAGGLENIPEELLPEPERVKQELDHAGLDVVLPGEDRAPVDAAEEHTDYPGAAAQPPQDV